MKTYQKEHTDTVSSIVFLSENEFVSVSHDKSIKIWKFDPLTNDAECTKTLSGHNGNIFSIEKIYTYERGVQ